MIEIIDNECALIFLKKNKIKGDCIFIRSKDKWWAYKDDDGKIISIIGIEIKNKFITIGGSYTIKNFRKMGYATLLIKNILNKYKHMTIKCYASDMSKNIYKKLGFKMCQIFNNGTELLQYGGNNE